jgi:hypothetical protein
LTTGDAFDDLTTDAELESAFGAAREERRAEEEDYTRAAARQWARHRDLVDVARELQHRGDTVSIQLPTIAFVGVLDAVGRDYVQLDTDGGRVDIALPATEDERLSLPLLIRVLARAREGGKRATPGAQTLRARLLEYDGEEIDVIVGAALLSDELRGRLTVGRDHILVRDRDGNETYLPLGGVAWVRPWRD